MELFAECQKLLLTTREAAAALSISERKLWSLMANHEITCCRIGRSVRYDISDLRQFVEEQKQRASNEQ